MSADVSQTSMQAWYFDTSAALKLILVEVESRALIAAIADHRPRLVSSFLLETEMRRASQRQNVITQRRVTSVLDRFDLYAVRPAIFTQAGLLPGVHLRSLDALHVASAIDIGVDRLVAYDARMVSAARDAGMAVMSPGQEGD